jgi:hypothetical protein
VVDGERHAAAEEREVDGGTALVELGDGQRAEPAREALIVGADFSRRHEHLVEEITRFVVGAEDRHGRVFGNGHFD